MADEAKPTDSSADDTRKLKLLVDTTPEPSFWAQAWKWIKKWVLAPLPAILLVVGAIVLVALGVKNLQIGGALGKLLGKDGPKGDKAVDKANSIPEDRVDKDGNLIPIGKPDAIGDTQARVVPIKPPSIWDDPGKVVIDDPDEGDEPIEVILPDGVKAKDVDKVLIVKPKVYAVTIRDSSSVTATDVDDLLGKYE